MTALEVIDPKNKYAENLQKIGAFKFRGAMNSVLQLEKHQNKVLAWSSGNHAQAIASAASLNNKKANSEIMIELNQNAGHFRYEVSKILTSKTVPSLCFKYDQSMERVQRLNTIFELVNTQSEKNRKT